MDSKKKCFVIMPFGKTTNIHTEDYWKNHYEDFLQPLIEINDRLIAHRSTPLRADILKEIITDLIKAEIVVADLTDHNVNVFYELGIRQSFSNKTITIAEKNTDIPFDISKKGILFYYPDDHIQMESFRTKFKKALDDCLINPSHLDSPVLDTIGGRGTLLEIIHQEEIIRKIKGIKWENKRNLESLEYLKKLRESRFFDGFSLISIATENLIINRYIEADDEFYEKITTYYMFLKSYVNLINDLQKNPHIESEQFFERIDNWIESISDYDKEMDLLIQNLNKIV